MMKSYTPGAAYDYFRGWSINSHLKLDKIKRTNDKTINPSAGYTMDLMMDIEKNDFIDSLDFSDSGTLLENFSANNLVRLRIDGSYHFGIPKMKFLTLSLRSQLGWISNNNANSFFPFLFRWYAWHQGLSLLCNPWYKERYVRYYTKDTSFSNKHYKTTWLIFQNATLGGIFQFGDAWTEEFSIKKSFEFS